MEKKYIWILITCICRSGQAAKKKTVSNLRNEQKWQKIEKPSFTKTIGLDKGIYE